MSGRSSVQNAIETGLEKNFHQEMSMANQLADKLFADCKLDGSGVSSSHKELDNAIYTILMHLQRLSLNLTEENIKLYLNALDVWAKLTECDESVNLFKVSPTCFDDELQEACACLSAAEIQRAIKLLRKSSHLKKEVVCLLSEGVRNEMRYRKPIMFSKKEIEDSCKDISEEAD